MKKLILFMVCVLTAPLLVLGGAKKQANPKAGVYFSYNHPLNYLVTFISSANKTLDVAAYGLNNPTLVNAIIEEHKKGVAVRIVTDRTQSGGKKQKIEIQKLVDAGIVVIITKGRRGTIMHHKFVVVDSTSFETGSLNWTNNAVAKNEENFIIVHNDRENSLKYLAEFQKIWDFQIQKEKQ